MQNYKKNQYIQQKHIPFELYVKNKVKNCKNPKKVLTLRRKQEY